MEATTTLRPLNLARLRGAMPEIVAFCAPMLVVVYLALRNGGYDLIDRSEVGVMIWWVLLLAVAVGSVSTRVPRAAAALAVVLLLYTCWTALSFAWTESAEKTAIEVSRDVVYLGVLILGIAAGRQWRAALAGTTVALALIVLLAVLSRLQPNLFPTQTTAAYFPGGELARRLAYPLNYSTGLAVVASMTIPLLLATGTAVRHLALRSLSIAMVPVCLLALWLTGSSLTIPLLVIGVLAILTLSNIRAAVFVALITAGAGGLLLIAASAQREALDSGASSALAHQQGDELTAMLVVVCAGVGMLHAAASLLEHRARRSPRLRLGRRFSLAAGVVALIATVVALAMPAVRGEISHGWDRFTRQSQFDNRQSTRLQQVLDPSSRGRYQYWEVAVEAGKREPLTGIGAGSFEYLWARERGPNGFARDAHSLIFESFGELGLPGALLALSLGLLGIGIACRRVVQARADTRPWFAGAGAAFIVFVAAAAVDWMWELSVVPIAALFLLGLLAAARDPRPASIADGPETKAVPGLAWRAIGVSVAVAALVAMTIPLASSNAVSASQAAAANGDLDRALELSEQAAAVEPYAATPELQRALILERLERIDDAVAAARAAADNEATNWRTWIVLSRLEARAGNPQEAVDAYRRARTLNPSSAIFVQS